MPRKAATQRKEPASLPEVPLPLSEVPESQRAAYEIAVIDDPEMFRQILSTEDFFQMIAGFPQAWWGDRLSMYLYRHESDDGLMVKNPVGEGNYIKPVIRQAVDRDWIANRNGGGKYCLWLNLSSPNPNNPDRRISTTVRKYTFRIDGAPLVKEGQIIERDGKPVTVGSAAPAAMPGQPSEAAQLMETSNKATESAMGILAHASETAIDMVKAQSAPTASQKDPLELAIRLMEVMRPNAATPPPADPVQTKLMEKIIDRAFATPEPTPAAEREETKLEEVSTIVETLTGKSLAELGRGRNAAPADTTPGWINIALGAAGKFIEVMPSMMAERTKQLALELQLRQMGANPAAVIPPNPARLPAAVIPISPNPAAAAPPAPPDKNQTIRLIIENICAGFDEHRDTGGDIGAAISVRFGRLIEAHGLEKALTDPNEMMPVLMQFPDLAGALGERSQHAQWKEFETDLFGYMQDRWGQDDGTEQNKTAGEGTQPPAA